MIVSSSAYRLIREVKVTRKTLLGLLRPSGKKVRARAREREETKLRDLTDNWFLSYAPRTIFPSQTASFPNNQT